MKIKAGFVGFGEVNTPREFIDGRVATAAAELEKHGVELVKAAPVSDDPDGKQAEDGSIYIIHDFARRAGGYVFMHRITEDDIIAGKLVTATSWLRRLVGESKPV